MRKSISITFIMMSVFLILLSVFFISFSVSKPRILVLHSYATDYLWVSDVNVGIKRVLDDNPYYAVRWHYMDTKNHPEQDFKEKAGIAARRMIAEWQPNIIIAVDDDAQQYAAKYFLNDPDMRIIFAGVNDSVESYGYHQANNVTGIYERKQLDAVKDAFIQIAQLNDIHEPVRVIQLGDNSETVKADVSLMTKYNWNPVQFVASYEVGTFEEWKKAVLAAEGQADFLMLTNYRRLTYTAEKGSKKVPPEEVVEWTMRNSKIPGIGTNGFNVDDGYMMAIGVSPYEQGEVTAKMAIRILEEGVPTSNIPYQMPKEFTIHLRESGLAKYQLKLPGIFEAFARATNNYFE